MLLLRGSAAASQLSWGQMLLGTALGLMRLLGMDVTLDNDSWSRWLAEAGKCIAGGLRRKP